jgi:hypothetical protein
MLVAHGAYARWAKTTRRYAALAIIADALLIAIAVLTIDQIQDLSAPEWVRIGVFFVAFGVAGRELMGGVLRQQKLL